MLTEHSYVKKGVDKKYLIEYNISSIQREFLEKSEFSIARENEEPASIENQERTAE